MWMRGILPAMNRLNAYYDRLAARKRWPLSVALVYTSTYGVLIGLGFLQIHNLLHDRGNAFYLYTAPLSLIVGIAGMLHGVQVVRAIRRKRASELNPSFRG